MPKSVTVIANPQRLVNRRGNTVLRDFGRDLQDVPQSNVYKIKLYFVGHRVDSERVKEWLRDRYISSRSKRGMLYQLRSFKFATDEARAAALASGDPVKHREYADYVLLEKLSADEQAMLILQFGDVTETKVIRTGKVRRPRLSKEQKKQLDAVINGYYLEIERERAAERDLAEAV